MAAHIIKDHIFFDFEIFLTLKNTRKMGKKRLTRNLMSLQLVEVKVYNWIPGRNWITRVEIPKILSDKMLFVKFCLTTCCSSDVSSFCRYRTESRLCVANKYADMIMILIIVRTILMLLIMLLMKRAMIEKSFFNSIHYSFIDL